MPNFGTFPQTVGNLYTPTSPVTASVTSAALVLPSAQSYRLTVQVGTVSGTSPVMYLVIATSFDAGATYMEVMSSGNMTTTGLGQQMSFRPYLGYGDAAANASTSLLGTADIAASVTQNGPINPQFIKLRLVVSGTSPSFGSVVVQYAAVNQDYAD